MADSAGVAATAALERAFREEWTTVVAGLSRRLGGVFGVAVVTAVFTATGGLGAPEQVAAGFRPGLAVAASLSVLGAVTALAVSRRRPGQAQPPTDRRVESQPADALPVTG